MSGLRTYLAESLRELWERPHHQMPALDAVRAAAVIAVVLSHFYTIFWTENMQGVPMPEMANGLVFYYGWAGVDLFFILSGYLIGLQLWREKQRTGTIALWEFFVRRGLRIWPLYFAILLLGVLAGVLQPRLSDLLFFSNYPMGDYERGWTLSTEEQFYIAVPLLLLFTPGIKRLWKYFLILGAVVISVWISRYYTCASLLADGAEVCQPLRPMVTPIHVHNEALIAGLAIALLAVIRPQYFERTAGDGFSWRGFAVLVVSFTLAGVLYVVDDTLFAFTCLALIFGSTTLWLLWDRSVFSWPATWRIWYPISRLSYGMYLNHFFLLPGITAWVVREVLAMSGSTVVASYAGIVMGLLVSMALAVVTFVLIERPFLLVRAYWIAGRKRSMAVDAEATSKPTVPASVGLG
jgi:peptidoglycan/LPS O-acetylase OafA/YrhL